MKKEECCKRCRHVKFKGNMTKLPVQKQTQRTVQKHTEHHKATYIQNKLYIYIFQLRVPTQKNYSDQDSVTSLDVDSGETGDETASESKVTPTIEKPSDESDDSLLKHYTGPIVIGGKEYDGVGRDTNSE